MKKIITLLMVLVWCLLMVGTSNATIRYCTTTAQCSTALMTSLQNNDTVDIIDTLKFTSPIYVTNKSFTIRGHGDSTLLIDSMTSGSYSWSLFWIVTRLQDTVRITNCTFEKIQSVSTQGTITLKGGSKNFRFDHNKITNKAGDGRGVHIECQGLIDHNTFDDGDLNNTWQAISCFGYNYDNNKSDSVVWVTPDTLGTRSAVYIEDNLFDFKYPNDGTFDAYAAAKIVFRYNTVVNTGPGWHEWCTSFRGVMRYEIYNNTITNDGAGLDHIYHCIVNRGGAGVIYNNTITGLFDKPLVVDEYRSAACYGTLCQNKGFCDGSQWCDGNAPYDSGKTTAGEGVAYFKCSGKSWTTNQWVGYYIWDITGMSRGRIKYNSADSIAVDSLSYDTKYTTGIRKTVSVADSFKISNGYPCRDQVGRTSSISGGDPFQQQLRPMYQWDNFINGVEVHTEINSPGCDTTVWSPSTKVIKNRDYYDSIPMPGYTAYRYPHPMQGGLQNKKTTITIIR